MKNERNSFPFNDYDTSCPNDDDYYWQKVYFESYIPLMMSKHNEPPPTSSFKLPDTQGSPFFRFPGLQDPAPYGPPFPLTREAFKELKSFFILTILADNTAGITGYQLQEKYKIPRSNVIRILRELERQERVNTIETIVSGRAQKKYLITTNGKRYLDKLKEEWALKFAFYSELAPPERFGHPFARPELYNRMMTEIQEFQSKEDALDYYHGYRSLLKRNIQRTKSRLDSLISTKTEVDTLVNSIKKWDTFKIEELERKLDEIKNKVMGVEKG